MSDPLTIAVATAVTTAAAGTMAGSLTEQARQAVVAITQKLRDKLRSQPAALAILDPAPPSTEAGPEDTSITYFSPVSVASLADALSDAFAADPAFRAEILSLWHAAEPGASEVTAADDAVVNTFRGMAGKVVQLRDIHGDLNIS
jgi:hypothetical protein